MNSQLLSGQKKLDLVMDGSESCQGILVIVLGDRSSQTFKLLWTLIQGWPCYFWVTYGNNVYKMFINPEDHIISKTYMTRVEGENTRLRHCLARLNRKTLCYSKSDEIFNSFGNSLSQV